MKAIIQNEYGGVNKLTLKEVEQPIISKDQILVKVYAANVSSGDMRLNTLDVPLLLIPVVKLIFGFKGPRNQTRGKFFYRFRSLKLKHGYISDAHLLSSPKSGSKNCSASQYQFFLYETTN